MRVHGHRDPLAQVEVCLSERVAVVVRTRSVARPDTSRARK